MAEAGQPVQDPGGLRSAVDRYRDLAKYLITIFAGVGALLAAGTQLASIGKLSFDDAPDRVLAACAGLALAVGVVGVVIALALRVLRPVELSLDDIAADPKLRAAVDSQTSALAGAGSLGNLRELLSEPLLDDDEREEWLEAATTVTSYAAYRKMEDLFEGTWRPLLIAAIVGVLGITAFAWGANPPDSATADPIVRPAPVRIRIALTSAGQETLASTLGRECVGRPVAALSIGGEERAPRVVILPEGTCHAAQFVLDPEWGTPISTQAAPTR